MNVRFGCGVLVTLSLGLAVTARAATWSIGPSIGFDVMSSNGSSLAVLAAPSGSDAFVFGARPGLRTGFTGESQHHQLFFDTGLVALSGSGSSLLVMSGTINYAYFFHSGSSPYVTLGLGGTYLGFDSSSEVLTLYGLGLGGRHRLGHGHGAIRLEARYDRATSPDAFSDPLNILGVRIGFDLDLN